MLIQNYIAETNALQVNESEKTIRHIITTNDKNRYDQIINISGIETNNFLRNPVVLFNHGSFMGSVIDDLPIGKCVELTKEENKIIVTTKFANTVMAKDIFNLNKEGFLNAWSIGFKPDYENVVRDNEIVYINKCELIEYSSVTTPANPNALNNMLEIITDENLKKYYKNSFALKEVTELNKINNLEEFEKRLSGIEETLKINIDNVNNLREVTRTAIQELNKVIYIINNI